MNDSRKGKLDAKVDEGIFLGYSNKRKVYKCLNLTTHKVIESAHVNTEEFVERREQLSNKEPEDYIRFVYYEREPKTLPKLQVVVVRQQQV